MDRLVHLAKRGDDLTSAVAAALAGSGVLARVSRGSRVALKPNFTYPYYKRGVTTSPEVLRAAASVLLDHGARVTIVETDGGYGAWTLAQAYAGHGVPALCAELGIAHANLCEEPRQAFLYQSEGRSLHLPLPTRLLFETDLLISLPVPKIHCMTGLSLAYKNQWGVIPDIMRLRRHYVFDDAIVAINRRLRPAVLADGTYFLDRNGPMEGVPVRMDLIIGASDAGAFDRYTSQLMGWDFERIPHLRRAADVGDLPRRLDDVRYNVHPDAARSHVFTLQRTPRNWVALTGFKSRFVTWLGYESWFGRGPLHWMLYAVAGKPVAPLPEAES